MKYLILLLFFLISIIVKSQDFSIIEELEAVKIGGELPKEIAEKYFIAKPDYYGTSYPIELVYFLKCQDITVVIITQSNGVCTTSQILLIDNKNGMNPIEYDLIMNQFDHDGSSAVFESTNYKFIDTHLIEVSEIKEVVKDSSKFNPITNWVNDDNSFWDIETETFEEFWYVEINENCRLIEIKPHSNVSQNRKFKQGSLKLLSENDLMKMSSYELRLMRNEIFADYGYKFKSRDLDNYFRRELWYDPKFEDVTHKLTDLEKRNIEIIIRQEKKKQRK